jgi:iron complex transport system substrate-binding protein
LNSLKKIIVAVVIICLGFTVQIAPSYCNDKPNNTRPEITDDFGHNFTLAHPPERIVILSGTRVDELFALGAGNNVVGMCTNVCKSYPSTCRRYPSIASIPSAGNWSNPNIEVIVSLKPNLIIAYDSQNQPGQYTNALLQTGVPFAAFATVNSVRHGLRQLSDLGAVLGKQKEAAKLNVNLKAQIDSITKAIAAHTTVHPRVFYWWGKRNGTYGNNVAINELITRAGGINVTGDYNGQYFEISTESLVEKNPEIIIYSYWEEDKIEERRQEFMNRPALRSIAAVKNNRVYPIDGHMLNTVIFFPEALSILDKYFHGTGNLIESEKLKKTGTRH